MKTPLYHSPLHHPFLLPFPEVTTLNSLGCWGSSEQWIKSGGYEPGCVDQISTLLLIGCETLGKLLCALASP